MCCNYLLYIYLHHTYQITEKSASIHVTYKMVKLNIALRTVASVVIVTREEHLTIIKHACRFAVPGHSHESTTPDQPLGR